MDHGILNPIYAVLDMAIDNGASDVHLKTGLVPALRINGNILQTQLGICSGETVEAFIAETDPDAKLDGAHRLESLDYSWVYRGIRFRCNVFHDLGGWCVSLRLLNIKTTDFAELGIPAILKSLVKRKSGLILVTGPTGSGKTTTLTCLIDYINRTTQSHIIMIEEPIEYVHKSELSIISQREIGRDAVTFDGAVVDALREDPDIILIGEMRDKASISAALRAAETGHLVLSTLHTKGAANTITRITDVFDPEMQNLIRMQLSMSLLAVVSQQLIPRTDKAGRVLASEVMIGTVAIQNLIRQQKTHMIGSTLQISGNDGMYSMRQSLDSLLSAGIISREDHAAYQIL